MASLPSYGHSSATAAGQPQPLLQEKVTPGCMQPGAFFSHQHSRELELMIWASFASFISIFLRCSSISRFDLAAPCRRLAAADKGRACLYFFSRLIGIYILFYFITEHLSVYLILVVFFSVCLPALKRFSAIVSEHQSVTGKRSKINFHTGKENIIASWVCSEPGVLRHPVA